MSEAVATNEELLGTRDVAKVLNQSTSNVIWLERTHQLKALRVSGVRVFKKADVDEFVKKRAEKK